MTPTFRADLNSIKTENFKVGGGGVTLVNTLSLLIIDFNTPFINML